MHFVCTVFFLFIVLSCSAKAQQDDLDLLFAALTALFNGLQYMQDHMDEINLDGAFGCRYVSELLQAFAESRTDLFVGRDYIIKKELMMLSEKANKIADEAQSYIQINDHEYLEAFGRMLEDSNVIVWHPGRFTNTSLRVHPLPLNESRFDAELSDGCLQETFCSREIEKNKCHLSMRCLQASSRLEQRDYAITHQILYLQCAEMRNCFNRCKIKVSEKLKDALCSNVMRDAEIIADNGFSLYSQDLFMEQVGVCGLWGYKDFYKREWLRNILKWQELSGCYRNRPEDDFSSNDNSEEKKRVKRTEKVLQDGCLSHKTGVALMALAASIRFSIEEHYR